MEKQFEGKLQLWLEKVVKECNAVGEKINLDYYPFQCAKSSLKENVDLLIIGANPGGANPFKERNTEELYNSPDGINNAYIGESDNKQWRINTPILYMFQEPKLQRLLENAIIMNVVYFNSKNVKVLSKNKEAINCCVSLTKEFIYEVIRPKAVLVLGNNAPKWLGIKYSPIEDSILRTKDDKSHLVIKVNYNEIPHYMIHHTSLNYSFNHGENIDLKKDLLQKEFAELFKY